MLSMFMCWFWALVLGVCAQVRGNSDGGVGSVVDGVSFPEYQAVCGELLTHGSQTAGIQRTRFASAGHQLGKFVWVWLNRPANAILNLCRRCERFRWKTRNGFDCYSAIYFMVFFPFFFSIALSPTLSLFAHSILCCIIPDLGFSNMFPVYLKRCKGSAALNCLGVLNIASSIEGRNYISQSSCVN